MGYFDQLLGGGAGASAGLGGGGPTPGGLMSPGMNPASLATLMAMSRGGPQLPVQARQVPGQAPMMNFPQGAGMQPNIMQMLMGMDPAKLRSMLGLGSSGLMGLFGGGGATGAPTSLTPGPGTGGLY